MNTYWSIVMHYEIKVFLLLIEFEVYNYVTFLIVNTAGYTDITLHFASTQISLVFAYKSGEKVLYYTSGK